MAFYMGEIGYLTLMRHILEQGFPRQDRTGVGTRALFSPQLSFSLQQGFPLLTTKKVHLKSVLVELLWFLSGSTNVAPLQAQGVTIWDEWAAADGDLGPVYGHQWRSWNANEMGRGRDQIAQLIAGIKKDPYGRRHIVTAWNPDDVEACKLPPCHCFFQCFVVDGGLLLSMYQRSADMFLGVPFNIASYTLLTHMLAQVCGLKAIGLNITFGDAHVYNNHTEAVLTQLSREPRPLPKLVVDPTIDSIDNFGYHHFTVDGYDPHPAIKAKVAV